MTFPLFSGLRGRDLPRNPYDVGNMELPVVWTPTLGNSAQVLRVRGNGGHRMTGSAASKKYIVSPDKILYSPHFPPGPVSSILRLREKEAD